MKEKVVIISGPSQSGKNTQVNLLLAKHHNLKRVITSTSRKPRPGEVNGKDYHFLKKKEFENKERFLEIAKVHTDYYGTQKKDLYSVIEEDKIPILVIDVQGFLTLMKNKDKLPEKIITIFLSPPFEILKKRIEKKGDPNEKARLRSIKKELEIAKKYQYILDTSKKPEENLKEIEAIIFEKDKKLLKKLVSQSIHRF